MSTPVNKKRLLPSTPKEQTIRSPRVPKSITKQPLREQKPKNGTPNTTSESSSRKLKRNFNIPPANKSLKNMNTTPVSSGLKAKNPETPKKRPLNLIDEARLEDSFSSINLLEKKNKSLKQRASILMDGKSYEPSYENSSIKVAVRVRPFSEREVKSSTDVLNSVITMSGNITKVTNPSGKDHEFVYDHSFWSIDADNPHSPYVTQEDVYRTVAKPLLHYSLEGYNTCLFAYGQTGSGKSYTVMGYESDNELGIIPRFSKDLFIEIEYLKNQHKAQYSVEISYYEIYNEKIFDLLSVNEARQQQQRLCVRENPDSGPYVQGLSTNIVGNHKDIQDWLEVGNKNRATASTGMNDKSSRSHSVFTIILTQVTTEEFEGTETQLQKTSKINLIDLAGSERAKKVLDDKVIQGSPQVMETRLKEGGCINKSLHTLGKVISMLSEMELKNKKKGQYIPYRDSVLTWLLKESLGGNAKTTMIATISPSTLHYSETLSTLRYAQQARSIVNNAKVNEDPKSKLIRVYSEECKEMEKQLLENNGKTARHIPEMLAEIQRLKNSQERTGDTGKALEKEVMVLRKNLNDTRSALATSTRSWQEKLASSEKKQKEAASHLRRSGVAFTKLEKHLPSLVNLNEDPQLAEVLLYILQEGVTNIGQQEPLNDNDIQLKSHMIADQHCIITYSQETVILSPAGDSPTYVNGCLVNEQTTLHHGDRLVIGGDHFFRLNHPKEALKLKDQNSSENDKTNKGFEFAKQEFIEKQNKRLEDELEEARLKAEEEAMEQIKNAQIKAEEEMKSQRSFFQQQMDELQKKLTDSTSKQKQAEDGQQNAQEIISQLKEQQKVLEDEILSNRKRLQTEALAARQILEETRSKQSQLIGSLESEKQKMQDDLNQLKDAKANRDKMRSSIHLTVNNQEPSKDDSKDLLKISLMTREANQISQCMKQPYSFDRVDLCRDGKVDIRIRITNKVTCKSTFINIDRFEEELSTMKDLSQNQNLINEKNFKWTKEESGNRKRTRFSFGGKPMDQSDSFISNFNQSFEQMKRRTLENSRLADESCSRLQMIDDSSQLLTPAESTRLSSVNQSSTAFQSDLSISRTSFFETILEIDTQNSQGASSIIASLINLIISIYKDWKLVLSQDGGSTSMMSGVGERTQLSDMDGPVVRMACNLKCLKDQASILCAVHEAVGLEDLKRISQAFREDIFETCSFVKKYILQREDSTELIKKQFKHLIYQLIELTGALSLSAVDHLDETDDEISYIDNDDENDIFIHFLKQQNRFLSSMMDEALNTVVKGVQDIKHLQLTQTHEMSEDLVDGVMNILTSTTTLIRRCKDLMMVYADINISETTVFYVKECFILRKFLTSVVDYNESVINIVEQSRQIASNCDAIEDFMDIPVELADTTKCICKAGRDLVAFLSTKKNLDQETLSLLRSCIEKFEFAGKTVRVGVAIVVQEIEKDLEIHEEHSILSFVQSEVSLQRTASMCPLNRTSLDMSAIHPQVQEKFKGRRSDVRPDMFISRYMDTTTESYNETRE